MRQFTIFVDVIWILRGQLTRIWIVSLAKLSPQSRPHCDSMAPWMLISRNFKQISCHIHVFIFHWQRMRRWYRRRRHITSNWLWLNWRMHALSHRIKWLNAIHVGANIWRVACSIVAMLCPRMWMPQLPQSKRRGQFSLSIGVPLVLRYRQYFFLPSNCHKNLISFLFHLQRFPDFQIDV